MKVPELVPVVSSNIKAVGYSPDEETLFLQFKQGAVYAYPGISMGQHQALLDADSIGKHFHKMGIKEKGVKLNV